MRLDIKRRLGAGVKVMHMPAERDGGKRSEPKRDQIDENLKRVYDETLNEPLPDKLAELLERLKKEGPK